MPKPIFAQNKKYYTRNENMNERIERERKKYRKANGETQNNTVKVAPFR